MTAQGLLLLILLGILIQLLIYAGIVLFRYWLSYQDLASQAQPAGPMENLEPRPEPLDAEPAWSGTREFRVTHRKFEDAAHSVCSFHLQPADGRPLPAFLPGQFLTFELDTGEAGKPLIRCYSLSDRPQPDHYRVSIKRVPAGRSSNHFHDHVQVGDLLRVKAPSGHFYLDPHTSHPVVLVAGGIGITPVFSMLAACLAVRPEREVWLFYGVHDGSEMVLRQELEMLASRHPNFHLQRCFSRPGADDQQGRDYQHAGRVDLARLRMELKHQPYHFYLCGPATMMESLVPDLEDWGIPPSHIHYEAFGPASISRRTPVAMATALNVDFARSGQCLTWTGGTLLELAEAHGVRVDSGCRAGGCGACQTVIEAGEVVYAQTPEFDIEPGSCLLCLAQPKTHLVLAA